MSCHDEQGVYRFAGFEVDRIYFDDLVKTSVRTILSARIRIRKAPS
jgi:hypothetical protein